MKHKSDGERGREREREGDREGERGREREREGERRREGDEATFFKRVSSIDWNQTEAQKMILFCRKSRFK